MRARRRFSRSRLQVSWPGSPGPRSEEHTSELQSQSNLVCRLLLEKKKNNTYLLLLCASLTLDATTTHVPRSVRILSSIDTTVDDTAYLLRKLLVSEHLRHHLHEHS